MNPGRAFQKMNPRRLLNQSPEQWKTNGQDFAVGFPEQSALLNEMAHKRGGSLRKPPEFSKTPGAERSEIAENALIEKTLKLV